MRQLRPSPRPVPGHVFRLIRPGLRNRRPYMGAGSPEALARKYGFSLDRLVKLDSNENPYGPSPRVLETLTRPLPYHRYPEPDSETLRHALAEYVGASPEQIVVGAGSDEVILLTFAAFLGPGTAVIELAPTFVMYRLTAEVVGARVITVPRDPATYEVDAEKVIAALGPRVKVVVFCSPNNPTGNLESERTVRQVLETGVFVIVDEAYYEYCGHTFAPLIARYPNLGVLRTFSKWAGLAGLRVGYGVFSPEVARVIAGIKPPFNVSLAGQLAALESLADREYLMSTVRKTIAERERLFRELSRFEFLRVLPSAANFIYAELRRGSSRQVTEALARQGILVRQFDIPPPRGGIRITVGRPEENERLLEALSRLEPED